ncbi:unnamed protein product, partial [Chrysoparadoxa australica]
LYYSTVLFNYTRVLFTQGKTDEAIDLFNKNLDLIEANNWPDIKPYIYYYLRECYKRKGNKEKVLEYDLLRLEQENLITKEKYDQAIAETQVKYETLEKEDQIKLDEYKILTQAELLRKTNKSNFFLGIGLFLLALLLALIVVFYLVQKRKNHRLEELVQQNQFLVSESNHRIKNNLQLITSLLHEQIENLEGVNKTIVLDISRKIDAIALLHKDLNLLSANDNIETCSYLNNLIKNFDLFMNDNAVDITLDCQPEQISIDHGMYLGIMVSELLTNSLKHAFDQQENPEILIATQREGEKF